MQTQRGEETGEWPKEKTKGVEREETCWGSRGNMTRRPGASTRAPRVAGENAPRGGRTGKPKGGKQGKHTTPIFSDNSKKALRTALASPSAQRAYLSVLAACIARDILNEEIRVQEGRSRAKNSPRAEVLENSDGPEGEVKK